MRQEELMIGDFVMHGFGKVGKVTAIDKGTATIYDKGFDDGDGHCEVTFASNELKPITLTDDILEKNFERDGERFFDCNEFCEITIHEYNDGLWEVEIDEIEFSSLPTWRMYVGDVHELQHALRLCSINKKIEI